MPTIALNGSSSPASGTSGSSSCRSCSNRSRSSSASPGSVLSTTAPRLRLKSVVTSVILLKGRPQAVAVHGCYVALHLLAAPAAHHGTALLMDRHGQAHGLVLGIAEVGLEDVLHVLDE